MSTAENSAICRRAVEAFNRGDFDAVEVIFTRDYVDHDPARAHLPPGPEGVRQAWSTIRSAFPDMEATIEEMVAEGDKVAVRGMIRGTHQGELMSIPPTGRCVEVHLIDINRVEDGRLAERWGLADMLGLLQQLGVAPGPAQTRG